MGKVGVSPYAEEEAHVGGQLKPNDLGLFDVRGNVAELCHCCGDDRCQLKVIRGSNFLVARYYAATRWSFVVLRHFKHGESGLRIARTLGDETGARPPSETLRRSR